MSRIAQIQRTRKAAKAPRVVIHGGGGVGKSTLASKAPDPVFIPLEDGLAGLEVDAFPLVESWSAMKESLESLIHEDHAFRSVCIDSIDWLEPLIWAEVCKRHGKPSIESFGYGKGYVEALQLWREFLGLCDQVRDRGLVVILIAHSEIKRHEAPDSEPYDRFQIKVHKAASALVQEWADIVGFAQHEIRIKQSDKFGTQKTRGIATGRRVLHLTESPAFVAKNRYAMPGSIALDWSELMGHLQSSTPENKE